MLNVIQKLLILLSLTVISATSSAFVNLGTSSESDKDLLVGNPVYMRNGVIELNYYLRTKDGSHTDINDRTVNQYGKLVAIKTYKFNIFQMNMQVDCNSMTGFENLKIWWDNDKIVLRKVLRNPIAEAGLRARGIIDYPINLDPGSDAQRAALYQCDHAIKLKKY